MIPAQCDLKDQDNDHKKNLLLPDVMEYACNPSDSGG